MKKEHFPNKIPIFPLSSAIFFPKTILPLNIFEDRYIQLVNDSMKENRMFGMVQPKNRKDTSPEVYKIGCLGKIVGFNETEDKRFIISLSGIIRFKIKNEIKEEKLYRNFEVDYSEFLNDLEDKKQIINFDNKYLLQKIKVFFQKINYPIDYNELIKLNLDQLKSIRQSFVEATQRAIRADVDVVELHVAHGYLLHQFYSPISNHRADEYGGSFANRIKFILDVVSDVRNAWPEDKPIGIRVTAQDWLDGGSTVEDCIELVLELKNIGVDYICVSSGGILPITNLVSGPGFHVNFANKIKKNTGITTRVVGEIVDYKMAQEVIKSGSADMVAIGRGYLNDPRWVWRASMESQKEIFIPNQYRRGFY